MQILLRGDGCGFPKFSVLSDFIGIDRRSSARCSTKDNLLTVKEFFISCYPSDCAELLILISSVVNDEISPWQARHRVKTRAT